MRQFQHVLQKSKSGKSIAFRIYVSDRFGKQKFNCMSLSGWRAAVAEKHLLFNQEEWNENLARKYVGMMVLRVAKDPHQGIKFLNHVKAESEMGIHFWAHQFLVNKKAPNAWKHLNGDAE